MISLLLFPLIAASAVWLAGWRDSSRDPRLTTLALGLMATFPLLLLLPRIPMLPMAGSPALEAVGRFQWITYLQVIWLTGSGVAVVRLLLSAIGLSRWRSRSRSIGQINSVDLRMLEGLHGPVAAGVFRKMILVPETWPDWDESIRRTILLHELEHHRRHDPLRRWIASLVVALHWFNPLVHWMASRLALQCEQACDESVVSHGVRADQYAGILFRFATRGSASPGLAMAESSSLESRIRHLMTPRSRKGFAMVSLLSLLTVGGAVILSVVGPRVPKAAIPDAREIELRLTANPFPADSP